MMGHTDKDFVKELFELMAWLDKKDYYEKAEIVYYAALHMKKLEEQLDERGKRMYS